MEKTSLVSSIKYQISRTRKWIRKNPKEFKYLIIILLVGAFFRLYKIGGYMTFLGDEGRDVIIVRRLLVDFDPILIGPRTSIGDMYLGPLYYYLMAPALLFSLFNPVGPAIMIAVLGVVTIFLVWYVTQLWFCKKGSELQKSEFQGYELTKSSEPTEPCAGALLAAFLYAISPVIITYSHSSWNPNIMPFFAFLSVYGIWKVWFEKKFKWLLVIGVSMSFVLQSHYLGLLLIPTLGLFWLLALIKTRKDTRNRLQGTRKLISYTLYAVILFAILMSPLVIFDARHEWRNFTSMQKFFTERQTTVSLKAWKGIPNIYPIFRDKFVTRIIAGNHRLVGEYTTLTLVGLVTLLLLSNLKKIIKLAFSKEKISDNKYFSSGFFITTIWLFIGMLGMSVYKQHVYDHYFGFLFPAPFLLIGAISQKIFDQSRDDLKILFTAGVGLLVVANLANNPLWYPPNHQMNRSREVAKLIQQKAKGKMFNLAVIAERNYEDGYQYFLEKENANVIDIDALRADETTADQLFVVCEFSPKECDPTHSPKAQVANFGWSEIEDHWEVMGITVFKLIHSR